MKSAHQRTVDSMVAAAGRIGDELARAKDNVASSAADTRDELATELRRLQKDLTAMQETIVGFGKASRSDAVGDFADNAKKETQSVMADLETFARQNPRYVLGGALGLGLVLGLTLRRH